MKSRCILTGFSNPGMLLILQVYLSSVNRTVKFDTLERLKTPLLPLMRRETSSPLQDRANCEA